MGNEGETRFHVGAWGLWLFAAMLGALLSRDPYYLGIVIGVTLLVGASVGRGHGEEQGGERAKGYTPAGLLKVVVAVTLVVAVFKGLWVNSGETVLWRLPDWWPDLGRVVTLEGLVFALLDPMQILAVLATFMAFSAGADYYAILRSTPKAMRQVGLVTSIALTFVPQTVTRFTEVREAQALRGHRIRRVGDLVPLVVPLLGGGMERSIDLAEAMESRGFSRDAGAEKRVPPVVAQLGIAGGLALVLGGGALFAFWPRELHWVDWLLILAGLGVIGVTLWSMGRGAKRTHYRRAVWRERDTLLAVVSAGVIGVLGVYKWVVPGALVYDPFPRLGWPEFDVVLGVALAGLVAPAVITRTAASRTRT